MNIIDQKYSWQSAWQKWVLNTVYFSSLDLTTLPLVYMRWLILYVTLTGCGKPSLNIISRCVLEGVSEVKLAELVDSVPVELVDSAEKIPLPMWVNTVQSLEGRDRTQRQRRDFLPFFLRLLLELGHLIFWPKSGIDTVGYFGSWTGFSGFPTCRQQTVGVLSL